MIFFYKDKQFRWIRIFLFRFIHHTKPVLLENAGFINLAMAQG